MQRYALIESRFVGATAFHRSHGKVPRTADPLAEGAALERPDVGISIRLAELYDGTDFDAG